MIKFNDYKNITFWKRSDLFPVDPELDEKCKDLVFLQKFYAQFEEVHVIQLQHGVKFMQFVASNLYWICIGSSDPDGIEGIDFVIVFYYMLSPQPVPVIRGTDVFYLIRGGPGIQINTKKDTPLNASGVLYPISALTMKHFNWNSYSTFRSRFHIFCFFKTQKFAARFVGDYWPNLLKLGHSPHKNKCFCKWPNKYIKKIKYYDQ